MGSRPTVAYDEAFLPDHLEVFEALMNSVIWDERMRARKTASFGRPDDYSGIDHPYSPFIPGNQSRMASASTRSRNR